jgi:hypothetical protein
MEDLALWGVNTLAFIFPFIDLDGWEDPQAKLSLDRMISIARLAKSTGLRTCLLTAPNSQFRGTPFELRGVPLPDPLGRRGNTGANLCPSLPAARRLILENHQRLFVRQAEVGLDLIGFWPYDEGGCACPNCAPWGANGFLSISQDLMRLARQYFPHIQSVLSTWTFDTPPEGEWDGLARYLVEGNDWVDFILADAHENFPPYPLEKGVPGNLPLLNFPEISMWGLYPWGGFGATPQPVRFQRLWDSVKGNLAGGFPYSEGIFEDINKAIYTQFYWDPNRHALDTLNEYIAYEYSPEVAQEVQTMVVLIESNQKRAALEGWADLGEAQQAFALARQVDARLPGWAKTSWRWRTLYLRALLDNERYQAAVAAGLPLHPATDWGALLHDSPTAQEAFRELIRIYHFPDSSEDGFHARVRPPAK